jgi:putative addiction module killer protein
MYELIHYCSKLGIDEFGSWLESIDDPVARARITARLLRVELGNFGDVESVGRGVSELRMHWGPGYRVYFARVGTRILLLCCGGTKKTQQGDIELAISRFEDWKMRNFS